MMDLVLQAWVTALIELARRKHVYGKDDRWTKGRPLRLLFVGYNGARNTGSDVRVEEMLRQVRQVLGADRVALSVLTQDPAKTRGYFGDARQVVLPDIFPPFLAREVPRHDGVVACEGSMFKSKFADALTAMMVGALGIASAHNRISVGYGAEAGAMNRVPRWMTRRYCRDSLVITRNEESRDLLTALGVPTELGTDTAWTMEPLPEEYGRGRLREAGWDGAAPVLAICPINPFWWPVKASLGKAFLRLFGAFRDSHYRSIYFHRSGREAKDAYARYLGAIAGAVNDFRRRTPAFPVLVAMEQLDSRACEDLAGRLGGAPVFRSSDHDMYQLVSILRCASLMLSSRYHGIVTSMPAGVASAGITMDERIRNLMRDRGHTHLLLEVDDPELETKLGPVLDRLAAERDSIREGIGRTVVASLKSMASMGVRFEEHVRQRYPDFPTRSGVHSWEEYLPPLSAPLRALVERYS
jgi:polysaccharide pyruvyl transferase WcaK-like protein